jgi:catechol 2,3-dioxygenase-like lactoylglutathione lyase family enzyme
MIAKSVDHISFSVTDLERSRRFYEDVLGLVEILRPEMGLAGAWYRAGDSQVHLVARPEGVDVGTSPGGLNPLANHQAFGIDDYEKCLEFIESRDIDVLKTSPERGQMWIRDPDGNVIELIAADRTS